MRFLDTTCIRTRFNERIGGNAGPELSVDLYLPPESGRYPIILHRTAADNNRPGRPGISRAPAERWKSLAAQGFIVATADVRGRGDSEGVFVPFVNEAQDGAATISWLNDLPESNGRIGLLGSGYSAYCAWAAAMERPEVDAIVSISPFGTVGEGLPLRGGAVRLDWLFWMHLVAGRTVQPAAVPDWQKVFQSRPVAKLAAVLGRDDIWWDEWLEGIDSDPSNALRLADRIAKLKVPGLHVTGWWDAQLAATHYYHDAARRGGAEQTLLVGPWDAAHVRRPASTVGGFEFGPRSVIDLEETIAAYFAMTLLGGDARPTGGRRLFFTGRNEWIDLESPSPEPVYRQFHLNSTYGANSAGGDGVLAEARPPCARVDAITHNPDVPVLAQPSFPRLAATNHQPAVTFDQSHITGRDEALVYTSAPLQEMLSVEGQPLALVTVRTDAADADIVLLLSDVFPTGEDLHLGHAMQRLGATKSFVPGNPLALHLQLDDLAHDFLPGHRVRLTIVPSLFPLYAVNQHSRRYLHDDVARIADIEVHHGPTCESTLHLPLLASGRLSSSGKGGGSDPSLAIPRKEF
jgi:putative CocE/NonD family hydrolase